MLNKLFIKNYALIKELELSPEKGLSIITGETGAGKSIMLGALGLLMGNRADTKALYDDQEKCIIEGGFLLIKTEFEAFFIENELDFEENTLLRREISPQGKSRAFINDTPVTLEILKSLGQRLMDIHSQHDTLLLSNHNYQLNLLDQYARNQNLLSKYSSIFEEYKKTLTELNSLKNNALSLQKEFDYNNFLYKEIVEAKLATIDLTTLESRQLELENAEELKQKLSLSHLGLLESEPSAISILSEINGILAAISNFGPSYKGLKDRLYASLIEIKDLAEEIGALAEKIEVDPKQLDLINESLNKIFKLQQKHGLTELSELIALETELEKKLNFTENLAGKISELEQKAVANKNECHVLALEISKHRKTAAKELCEKMQTVLHELGMPNAVFTVEFQEKEIAQKGLDEIIFTFSANKGVIPKSLKDVASGGEFARLMLAFKYELAKKTAMPTMVLDEIDTGISGEIAIKVGQILVEMSKNIQVITITHLHQIAAKGHVHFYVYKDNTSEKTNSKIKQLSSDERIITIAQMIGGENPSDSAIKNAIELLQN